MGNLGGFLPRVFWKLLLVHFLENLNVVDSINDPNVVVSDSFVGALQEGGEVDGGGARYLDDGECVEEARLEGFPVINVDFGGPIDAAGPGRRQSREER